MRNALILLAIVAVLILLMGALNNGTAFDVDYVAGTVSAVSLFWVSAVIAALVVVAGLAAAWFALSACAGSRRKLEAELQSTYVRLREAEALAARPAPAAEPVPTPVVVPAPDVAEEETAFVADEATLVAGADETTPGEDVTLVSGEEATVVAGGSGDDGASAAPDADEQTAVTTAGTATAVQAGEPPEDADPETAAPGVAGDRPADDAREDETGRSGP